MRGTIFALVLLAALGPTVAFKDARAQSGPTIQQCERTTPTRGVCPAGCEYSLTRTRGGVFEVGHFCRLPQLVVRPNVTQSCDVRGGHCIPMPSPGTRGGSCNAASCGPRREPWQRPLPDVRQQQELGQTQLRTQ